MEKTMTFILYQMSKKKNTVQQDKTIINTYIIASYSIPVEIVPRSSNGGRHQPAMCVAHSLMKKRARSLRCWSRLAARLLRRRETVSP